MGCVVGGGEKWGGAGSHRGSSWESGRLWEPFLASHTCRSCGSVTFRRRDFARNICPLV